MRTRSSFVRFFVGLRDKSDGIARCIHQVYTKRVPRGGRVVIRVVGIGRKPNPDPQSADLKRAGLLLL